MVFAPRVAAPSRSERPGRIVEELRRVGVRNPVFVLDEVDRLDEAGGSASALLEAINPPPGAAFRDRHLDLPFDLSEALFVATATRLGSVPAMLRERMRVIELPGSTEAEKRDIAARYLLPLQLQLHGLTADQVDITAGRDPVNPLPPEGSPPSWGTWPSSRAWICFSTG